MFYLLYVINVNSFEEYMNFVNVPVIGTVPRERYLYIQFGYYVFHYSCLSNKITQIKNNSQTLGTHIPCV
jgi:hypothetical protein